MDKLHGCDISLYQPRDCNWQEAMAAGLVWGSIKLSQRDFIDPEAVFHVTDARREGLKYILPYHYLDPVPGSAHEQADTFLNAVERCGGWANMLVPALDVEGDYRNTLGPMDSEGYNALALAWLKIVEAEVGAKCVVYTYPSFNREHGVGFAMGDRHLWAASYPEDLSHGPAPFLGWHDGPRFWQYTASGGWCACVAALMGSALFAGREVARSKWGVRVAGGCGHGGSGGAAGREADAVRERVDMREETIGGQRLVLGDNLQALPLLADCSFDLVVTDPPYGISFMGKSWDRALPDPQTWRECFRVLKPGGSALVMSGSRLDCLWRLCRDLEAAGFELSQTALYWCYRSGFPKGGDLSKLADARAGAEREVVGRRTDRAASPVCDIRGGRLVGGASGCIDLSAITAPATPLAVALDGWFTKGKVKPAVEVIIWARKPISEKTELDNMVRWGVGGVNCGACMVPLGFGEEATPATQCDDETSSGFLEGISGTWCGRSPAGRFPANLLVTDDALGAGTRYFDVDRWAEEHGYTEDGWADAAAAGMLQIAKPSRAEKNAGCEGLDNRRKGRWNQAGTFQDIDKPAPNPHPTCKPVRLFAYLLDFLCPAGGNVLDPFLGSGTTLVAAAQTGRRGTGIELEPDYFTIAEARVRHATQQQREATEAQLTLDAMASA